MPTVFTIQQNPWRTIAVHDFGDEHAHLAGSVFDQINPLILAALRAGKSHVDYRAPANCVPGSLKAVLAKVSAKYGPVTVNSTYRSPGKNRKAGGKRKSMHLSCRAVDFRVHGNSRGLMQFLAAQKEVGGSTAIRRVFTISTMVLGGLGERPLLNPPCRSAIGALLRSGAGISPFSTRPDEFPSSLFGTQTSCRYS